eukprot:11217121-Lingulodinium_polyedra.AAC.1
MGYIHQHRVYKPSSMAECLRVTGRAPLDTGWSDTNKGDVEQPNFRSRFVAKEYRRSSSASSRARLFAGTPPS